MAISLDTYIRRQQVIRNRMEKHFIPLVKKALQSQVDDVTAYIRDKGVLAAQGMIAGDVVNGKMISVMRDLYSSAAKQAIIKPVAGKKGLPGFIMDVLKYLDKHLLDKVVLPISATTVKEVDEVLEESLENGWGVDETIARLDSDELTYNRAQKIVRTETTRAVNFAQTVAADNLPYEVEKQWIAIEDNRTRTSHSNHGGVDGQRVDLYDPYSNGLMYPGDAKGAAKEVINCRCVQGFFAKRDLEGNIIPKKARTFTLLQVLEAA